MLTKDMVVTAAKEAKESNTYVYIIRDNGCTKVKIDNYIPFDEKVRLNTDILQVLTPEQVLRYDVAAWNGLDVSIDALVNEINLKFV